VDTPLRRIVKGFRGELVFKAHRHVYHSTLGSIFLSVKHHCRAKLEQISQAQPDTGLGLCHYQHTMFEPLQIVAHSLGSDEGETGFEVGASGSLAWVEMFGKLLDLRATAPQNASQNCEGVPSRASISGSQTCASLISRLESDQEEKDTPAGRRSRHSTASQHFLAQVNPP